MEHRNRHSPEFFLHIVYEIQRNVRLYGHSSARLGALAAEHSLCRHCSCTLPHCPEVIFTNHCLSVNCIKTDKFIYIFFLQKFLWKKYFSFSRTAVDYPYIYLRRSVTLRTYFNFVYETAFKIYKSHLARCNRSGNVCLLTVLL